MRRFLRSSVWLGPSLGLVTAIALYLLFTAIDNFYHMEAPMSVEGARTVISGLSSAMLSLIVFVMSSMLVVLQLASAQLSPRIIARIMEAPAIQAALAIFTFTFTFSLGVLTAIDNHVPLVAGRIAIWGSLFSLCAFFYLVGRLGRSLRPISILTAVANEGADVIRAVYADEVGQVSPSRTEVPVLDAPALIVRHEGRSGVVLGFDQQGLVELARRSETVIRMRPEVGDFVVRGDVLFEVYGDVGAITERALRHSVDLGAERTVRQDPCFSFRIIVDIAAKALSPAINDPTTAVLALDQLHLLLRVVGLRHLDTGITRDASGKIRLIFSTPDWEDFVWLGLTEIREFGATSMQVMRRMRALILHLLDILPEERRPCLRRELALLDAAVARSFPDEDDRWLAGRSDLQGLGGSTVMASRS